MDCLDLVGSEEGRCVSVERSMSSGGSVRGDSQVCRSLSLECEREEAPLSSRAAKLQWFFVCS